MSWIKRNIIFVASLGIGVLLMAAAGYFLYNNLNENNRLSEEFKQQLTEYQTLRNKTPYPSDENIQTANKQKEEMRVFLGDFKKAFSAFPAPPTMDEKSFSTFLSKTITELQREAFEAGVGFTQDYSFSFSSIYSPKMEVLSYPPGCIAPWLSQLEEIKTICGILFHAKINYLEGLRRVPVCSDLEKTGSTTSDFLNTSSVTNQLGVLTPYEITFRGFSDEIAGVLNGFLQASNCFMVKSINVEPSKAPLIQPTAGGSGATTSLPSYIVPARPRVAEPPPRFGTAELFGGASPSAPPRPAPRIIYNSPATTPSGPMPILWARPLHVTITVEVLKLKSSQ